MTVDAHAHRQLLETQADADRRTIETLQLALQTSRRIGAAVGVVMAIHKVTEAEAFEVLKHASQSLNRKLREVADDVVATGVVPSREHTPARAPNARTHLTAPPNRLARPSRPPRQPVASDRDDGAVVRR